VTGLRAHILVDCGQAEEATEVVVVHTDDADVVWNTKAQVFCREDGAEAHFITGAEDCCWRIRWVAQNLLGRVIGTWDCVVGDVEPVRLEAKPGFIERLFVALVAVPRLRELLV
jgi:hypothetical protein